MRDISDYHSHDVWRGRGRDEESSPEFHQRQKLFLAVERIVRDLILAPGDPGLPAGLWEGVLRRGGYGYLVRETSPEIDRWETLLREPSDVVLAALPDSIKNA